MDKKTEEMLMAIFKEQYNQGASDFADALLKSLCAFSEYEVLGYKDMVDHVNECRKSI